MRIGQKRSPKKHGRRPKTLHIGNVANNAYRAAQLLRKIGFDADVICSDYYHAFSTPEWEDAFFDKNLADLYAPEWHKLEIKDFERQDWFAQGTMAACVKYLKSRNVSSDSIEVHQNWVALGIENKTLPPSAEYQKITPRDYFGDRPSRLKKEKLIERFLAGVKLKFQNPSLGLTEETSGLTPVEIASLEFERIRDDLIAEFEAKFPDREDIMVAEDFEPYRYIAFWWQALIDQYDIVQGYSIDPLIPMLCGVPYFAFEHGTLRDIPFSDHFQGRLTALSYSKAEFAFVTNIDCVGNAEKLCGDKMKYINHPFNEDIFLEFDGKETLRANLLEELNADFLVFFSTRHDWIEGKGFNDKGNDLLLRACGRLSNAGYKIGVVLCNWGHNVEESKALIEEYGYTKNTKWIEPAATQFYRRIMLVSDIVADQFVLGAFGGIFFNALSARAPICTYLDENIVMDVFSEMPPVINCRTEDEIYKKLKAAFDKELDLEQLGQAGWEWMKREHAWKDGLAGIAEQYIHYLEENPEAIKDNVIIP